MKYLHIFISALDAIVLICLVSIDFYETEKYRDFQESVGFKEAVQFETILFLRYFRVRAFLHPNTMRVMLNVTMIFEIYVYFVVRNHLLFIIVLCRSIRNSADGWNSRIACFFGTGNNKWLNWLISCDFSVVQGGNQGILMFWVIIPWIQSSWHSNHMKALMFMVLQKFNNVCFQFGHKKRKWWRV